MSGLDSSLYDYFRVMAMLSGVLILAWIALRYWLPKIAPRTGAAGLIEVIERQPLDGRNALYVVRAGSKYLLLGATPEGLNRIGQLDAAEVRLDAAPASRATLFSRMLQARGHARAKGGQ